MIAIVIPYYNIAFFEKTLKSLANQTDQRFKVFIGDDTSPENPTHLLEKYKGKFDFVYYQFDSNLGSISLTKHWERCIALIGDEEWIMILGDDDVLGKNVVEMFYKHYSFLKDKTNIVRFTTKVIDGNNQFISNIFEHPIWEKASDAFYRRHLGKTRSSLSEYIFLKDSYLKYKFKNYPLAWHSDDFAWLDFAENKPIYSINDSSVFIRISPNSITGNNKNEELKIKANIQFLKDCLIYKEKKFSKTQRLELMMTFEVTVKKYRQLYRKELLLLLFLYYRNFDFIPFVKYNRRFLIHFFNL